MQKHIVLLTVLLFNHALQAQQHTISGYIKDKGSGESLIAANVFNKINLKGTTTNTYGFYSLTLPQDSITLVVSYVGYAAVESRFYLDKDIELNIELSSAIELDEIVVTAEEEIQEQTQMSTVTVQVKQIQALPSLMGEVDVLKVLQLLPGVQSGTEGSSGLYVRGGGPDQNLILLDGVPIYNSSHLFGFFSVFNADAINNVELIKGGFPARYGGRLSSVIDISMKEGSTKEFKGTATIGLIASKVTLEAPIIKDKTSFLFSARRTYIDILAQPIIKAQNDGLGTAGYYFYDLNAKINHKFSNKDRLYLSGFFGKDKAYSKFKDSYSNGGSTFEYEDKFGLNWGNSIGSARWNHLFSPKIFSNFALTYSRYNFAVFEESNSTTTDPNGTTSEIFTIQYDSGIEDFAAKLDFDYIPNPNHYIRFGINGIDHTFNPGVLAYKSTDVDTVAGSFQTKAFEFATYIEDDFRVTDKLKVNAGVHFSGFNVESKTYTSLQPRIAARFLLNSSVSIKASYAQMAQYIHLLSNSGIGLPTDLWVPSTNRVKPQSSFQYALGVAKTFNKSYELSVEGYYKKMDNLIEYKDGASFTSVNKDWQDKIEVGSGTSYGAEVFFQKKLGRLTGWVGYTLSWSNRQFENVNFGKEYPYRYDRRHDISLTSVYKLSDHIELAAIWVYGTGNSVSLPTKTYLKNASQYDYYSYYNNVEYYEGRNGYRMDAYHRLDFSIAWTKVKKNGIRKFTLGFYNMYNRKNPFFIQAGYDYKTQTNKFIQYSLMPIIPSISYRFDF
jgi:outer membrane receptor for ferrienterochelin and colicin